MGNISARVSLVTYRATNAACHLWILEYVPSSTTNLAYARDSTKQNVGQLTFYHHLLQQKVTFKMCNNYLLSG